ncbi:hypothetical protein G9A89_023420 [Geosiphon pyriformis]|nr:hypothetical protein G9A89_023420 [Geosiphon pyriformis]
MLAEHILSEATPTSLIRMPARLTHSQIIIGNQRSYCLSKFTSFTDVGKLLARLLTYYANHKNTVVYSIKPSASKIALEIAQALNIPLGLFLIRLLKINGLTFGAICDKTDQVMLKDHIIRGSNITQETIDAAVTLERAKIQNLAKKLSTTNISFPSGENATIILVTDGIQTGQNARATLSFIRMIGYTGKIVLVGGVIGADAQAIIMDIELEKHWKDHFLQVEFINWKISKIMATNLNDERIVLNIGGIKYETFRSTLTAYPDTLLGTMFSKRNNGLLHPENGNEYFFDRNGRAFHHILEFYRTGQLLWPSDSETSAITLVTQQELAAELEFFQIPINLKYGVTLPRQMTAQELEDFQESQLAKKLNDFFAAFESLICQMQQNLQKTLQIQFYHSPPRVNNFLISDAFSKGKYRFSRTGSSNIIIDAPMQNLSIFKNFEMCGFRLLYLFGSELGENLVRLFPDLEWNLQNASAYIVVFEYLIPDIATNGVLDPFYNLGIFWHVALYHFRWLK